MATLTGDRTPYQKVGGRRIPLGVAASTTIYKGSKVAINSGGYAVPADDADGLIVIGVAEHQVVNAGANGAETVRVLKGTHGFELDSGDPPTVANIGKVVYVKTDHEVCVTGGSTHKVVAGVLDSIVGSLAYITFLDAVGLGEDQVKAANIDLFVSTEQTGTGSEQNVAHGLGAAPSVVLAILTEFADTLAVDVAYGTHDVTNCKVTVASGAKFKILAIR